MGIIYLILTVYQMKSMRFVLLGAPGSGKGTLAKRILDRFPLDYLCYGDVLRENVRLCTGREANFRLSKISTVYFAAVGRKVGSFLRQGHLIPDQLACELMQSQLLVTRRSWLLDGSSFA